MDSQPQHGQLITIHPQHAAEPILPALRAGVEHAIDFETLFAAALLYSIKGRHGDERFSTTPPAFTVLFWHGYFFVSRRARRYAWCFCPMSGCRARRPDVRHVGCQDERGASCMRFGACHSCIFTIYCLWVCSKWCTSIMASCVMINSTQGRHREAMIFINIL